jgi:hypothetical protein
MQQHQIEKIKVNKFLMTPEKASELLNKNTRNRKASKLAVSLYYTDMLHDNFNLNGSTICVAENGVLIDGQQRLMACERAKKPFWTILVEDLPEEAILSIDSGKKRTYADRLKIRGYDNAGPLAHTVKMVALIANKTAKDNGYTVHQLDTVLAANPDLIESVCFCRKTYYKADALLGAIHYIASKTGYADQGNEFIRTWRDGQMNYPNDPVVYIREKLNNNERHKDKMTTTTRMKYIMLSWHKFKNSSEMNKAYLPSDGFYMDDWDTRNCRPK